MNSIVRIFALAGGVIPLLLLILIAGFPELSLDIGRILNTTIYRFLLWPSQILLINLLDTTPIGEFIVYSISILLNILFYTYVGFLVKWSLTMRRP